MNSEEHIFSVSELTSLIKESLEARFPRIWLEAEISNSKLHSSGHFYFTLKDERSQISAVMWRNRVAKLQFSPEDGMKVNVRGAVTVYPPRGAYQLDVVHMAPLGIGELQIAFERLKQKLDAEGLFDPANKKPVPEFPGRIGIVTSPTGAALQDIRSVLARRFPAVEVVLSPVRVQGAGAAREIADAIREMNEYGEIDVLIVGRGGGSLEDLWPFNEEVVARAIYRSRIPVVSAVGHEIDFSIADFVADVRAATPSAAAELVVPDRTELLENLRTVRYTIEQAVNAIVASYRQRIDHLLASYSFNRPRDLLSQYAQRVDELERSLSVSAQHQVQLSGNRFHSILQRLESVSPRNVLRRGYTLVWKGKSVVKTSAGLTEGDDASLEFHDGDVPVRVGK